MSVEDRREIKPYMDLLRCMALYLVVLLHTIADTYANPDLLGTAVWWGCNVLNSAARMGVPLFFMLSGALLLPDPRTLDPLPFYRKRFLRLLLPFLCWDIVYFLENAWFQSQAPSLRQFFVELLTLRGSKYHLWYVYKIASIYLLLPFLKRALDHCRRRDQWLLLGIILLPASVFPLIDLLPGIGLDLFGAPIDGRVGFFLLGYLLAQETPPPWARRLLYGGGVLAFLLNIFGNYWCSAPGQINYWFNGGCVLTHYLTAGAVFLLAKEHAKLPPALGRLCRRISSLSYGVYLSHALFLDVCSRLLGKLALGTTLTLALSFLLASCAATVLIWLLSLCKPLRRLLVSGA